MQWFMWNLKNIFLKTAPSGGVSIVSALEHRNDSITLPSHNICSVCSLTSIGRQFWLSGIHVHGVGQHCPCRTIGLFEVGVFGQMRTFCVFLTNPFPAWAITVHHVFNSKVIIFTIKSPQKALIEFYSYNRTPFNPTSCVELKPLLHSKWS